MRGRSDREASTSNIGQASNFCIDDRSLVYTGAMSKHLIDIDESALSAAQAQLRTSTMKDTVNEALRQSGAQRNKRVKLALDRLGKRDVDLRESAWR
jgi:Arc/MetJ family transcription regulator